VLERVASSRNKKTLLLRTAFVVLFTAFLLLLAELALRYFGPSLATIRELVDTSVQPYGLKPGARISFAGLHEPLPAPVTWQVNSQGIRANQPISSDSRKFRVATYGDSETFGWGVELQESFQARMEALDGRIEVINFGVPGYNAANIADTIARTAPRFHPDLIVYLVHGNDFDDTVDVNVAEIRSSLLRLVVFAYYRLLKQPWENRLRSSPERIERFVAQIERITRFCQRSDIPLVLAFLKWRNHAVLPEDPVPNRVGTGPAGRDQNWGLPRHLNADTVLDNEPSVDSHLTTAAYKKLARFLCATISGKTDSSCIPPAWHPAGE
jgi:hypothetical protein